MAVEWIAMDLVRDPQRKLCTGPRILSYAPDDRLVTLCCFQDYISVDFKSYIFLKVSWNSKINNSCINSCLFL